MSMHGDVPAAVSPFRCRRVIKILPNSKKTYFCTPNNGTLFYNHAEVAHLVEHDLAKVGVAGSSPVFRSR